MHLNVTHLLTFTALISTTLAAPMWREGTCGPEEDLACYPDGSNGKRSALPEPEPMLKEGGTCGPEEDLACYGKRAALPEPEPMLPEACGPATDRACYPNSIEKRSDSDLNARRPPTLTATRVTIPPLGAPTGFDGGGYLRRSKTVSDTDGIVIGSKPKRSPEQPEIPEDVGAYDEEKRRRSLSLDAEGHPILTGDNYPVVKRDIPSILDKESYPIEKREISRPPIDKETYPIVKIKSKRERPIDDADYPEDLADYPITKAKSKRSRILDASDYPEDFGVYPEARKIKREADPSPSPLEKIEIDGDYPQPDDSSYPVKKRMDKLLDSGDYAPPDDMGGYLLI